MHCQRNVLKKHAAAQGSELSALSPLVSPLVSSPLVSPLV